MHRDMGFSCKSHTIVLIQFSMENLDSRTYLDFESIEDALNGMFSSFAFYTTRNLSIV